ncbi:hypothetical protein, partial [Nocardia brevicatena]|uniref:hypothetical protein n=1 Tax=Nocardia brevicatena TaxID=37327 RepID=UPI001FE07B6F
MLEGRILAVSSQTQVNAAIPVDTGVPGAPKRVSFATLREPLAVPGLLNVQTESFEWLIGAPAWRERAAARGDSLASGLEEILEELSPIEDFAATMSLTLSEPRFEEVKASIEE